MSFRAQPRVADDVVTLHRVPRTAAEPAELAGARRSDPLLVTKLCPAPARAGRVPRPDLLARLDAGVSGMLTLLSAPAGYGKSTLLAAWVDACPLPVAWVALDEGDSDPARFWSYVIAALRALSPEVRAHTPDLPEELRETPIEPAVAALINALAGLSDRVALVLDDYHLVDSEDVQRGVAFLIDHLPPQLHVLIACRADPPLPLSRWRVQGTLTELRAADLRFSPEEAGVLLATVLGRSIAPGDVAALDERVEGWAAGLQLAALALREHSDVSRFVAAFSGSHRVVVDYLIDEVVGRLPDEVQTFLVETAQLDRLSGPLCDAVTGRCDGQAMLERLERANLFLIPLDDERRWYRYHHLLSDVLRDRLRAGRAADEALLHARAAAWFEEHDFLTEAIRHGLAAGDWERVAGLIKRIGGPMLTRGEFVTLLGWIGQVPQEFVRRRSSLCRIHAWALVFTGRLAEAEAALADAVHDEGKPSPPGIASEIAAVRSCIARFRGDIQGSLALTEIALEHAEEQDTLLYGVVLVNHAAGLGTVGDFAAAYQTLDEADRLAQETGSHLAVLSYCHRGRLLAIQGCLREAVGYFQRALQLGSDDAGPSFPAASYASIGVGAIWYQWNRLDAATRALTDGVTMSQGGRLDLVIVGYLTLAQVKWAAGDPDSALELSGQARELSERYGVPHISAMVDAFSAWLALVSGDLDVAERWSTTLDQSAEEPLTYRAEEVQLVRARLALARGRPAEALPLLDGVEVTTAAAGRAGHRIEALVIASIVQAVLDDRPAALAALRQALELAEPQGYKRVFLDEGSQVAELLAALRRDPTLPRQIAAHVDTLLAAFNQAAAQQSCPEASGSSATDALTPRELEVLTKLAGGLSNREIADTLFVSIGTVKRHTNSIYGKLGVSTRGRAVARARELHLVGQ